MENNNPEIWKYYKVGDVILDCPSSIWGDRKFRIASFFGTKYCAMCLGYFYGKRECWKTHSNLPIEEIILIDAPRRPFRRTALPLLIKLMQKGNVEAKREFIMRSNNKKYAYRLN